MIKKVIIIFFILISFISFFKINEINYKKHREIKRVLVSHPENLPKKELAIATSFWFKNLRANMYWLQTIQYIWWNAFHSEYKKYLYKITDLVTELNPRFENPYVIAMLLLPDYNPRYEDINEEQRIIHENEAIEIWIKWLKNFCDLSKINLIDNENDLSIIWNDEGLKNPCYSYKVPYFLAYNYFFHKNDPINAAKYYKVTSSIESSPSWAKDMAAVMLWKWWDREKSFFMFLNLANFLNEENEICDFFIEELDKIWKWVFIENKISLSWKILKTIEDLRYNFLGNNDEESVLNWQCINYVNKSTRELNLYYIEEANNKHKSDFEWTNAKTTQELFEKWYIDYIPLDYQRWEDFWIIYKFNEKTWNFDYEISIIWK